MKIIQIIYSLSSGGAERFVVDLSNELAHMGHNVTLCILLDESIERFIFNKKFLSSNVRFHAMNLSKGFSLSKSNQVERFIKKEKPDIVHCHLNVIPYIFRLCITDRHIKFFHTLHSVAENASGGKWQVPLNKFFYKYNLIKPICISKLCQDSYIRLYHLNNAPFINNGRGNISPSDRYYLVKDEVTKYKNTSHTPVFIHVARFDRQKNQQLLIDSFNILFQNGYDFTLLIIGNGYESKNGLALQKQACPNIHFIGEKSNVCDYLLCSDAFCLTSIFEGLPISLLEALACGLTPICTSVGGIPDVITEGITGYLSPEPNKIAYTDTVKRFLRHPLDKKILINYFKANFTIQICAEQYETEYLLC